MSEREIPNTREIGMYLHCGLCLEEGRQCKEEGKELPRRNGRLGIGYTRMGIQVWCEHHDCNVIHLDFDGKSPFNANLTRHSVEKGPQGTQAG